MEIMALQVADFDKEVVEKIVKNSMEDCIKLKVGLKVDVNIGKDWYI